MLQPPHVPTVCLASIPLILQPPHVPTVCLANIPLWQVQLYAETAWLGHTLHCLHRFTAASALAVLLEHILLAWVLLAARHVAL